MQNTNTSTCIHNREHLKRSTIKSLCNDQQLRSIEVSHSYRPISRNVLIIIISSHKVGYKSSFTYSGVSRNS